MSKTLLNRLAMFGLLDVYGPLTVTELARRSGLDATVVSRTVAACEPAGWLVRVDGRVAVGPRCTLLGHRSPIAAVLQQAETLVHAVAGVTGLLTQAFGLVGHDAVLIAAADGANSIAPSNLSMKIPAPQSLAAGQAVISQLGEEALEGLLPPEPYPEAATILAELTVAPGSHQVPQIRDEADRVEGRPRPPRTRGELEEVLASIRRTGFALDVGAVHPSVFCIAVPWPQPGLPSSLACLGPPDRITANGPLVRRTLTVAASPGATARDVVVAAADVMTEGDR